MGAKCRVLFRGSPKYSAGGGGDVVWVSIHGNIRQVILWDGLSLLTQEHVVTSLE